MPIDNEVCGSEMDRTNPAWPDSPEVTLDLDALKIDRLRAVALASKHLREMLAAEYEASRKKEEPQEK